MKRSIVSLTIPVIVFFGSVCYADDFTGYYLGLDAGYGHSNVSLPNGEDKTGSGVVGILAGYKFNPYFGVETKFTGTGKVDDKVSGAVKADAVSLNAIGFLPLNDQLNMYAKFGVAEVMAKVNGNINASDNNETGLTVGLGVDYALSKAVSVRVGWDRYKGAITEQNHDQSFNADVYTAGLTYRF